MIEKKKVLKTVAVLHDRNAIDVLWSIQFLEDGVIKATAEEPTSYTQDRKDQLLTDVTGAEHYAAALGW